MRLKIGTASSHSRPPWTLLGAVGFLVLSLIVAGLLVAWALSDSGQTTSDNFDMPTKTTPTMIVTMSGAHQELNLSQTPQVPVEGTIANPVQDRLSVGLAPLRANGDPAIGERLRHALEASLGASGLPVAIHDVSLPADFRPSMEPAAGDGGIGSDLLVVWESREGGSVAVFIVHMPDQPLARIDEVPEVWTVSGLGDFAIVADAVGDLSFVSELVTSTLEIVQGNNEQANTRLRALQARPTTNVESIRINNEAALDFTWGQVYARQGDLASALRAYSQALRLQRDFMAAHISRGNVYLALGDIQTALSSYSAALALDPINRVALHNRAIAYYLLGDPQTALEDAQRLVELSPEAAWSASLRGYMYYALGDDEAALSDFERAHTLAPGEPAPLFNQALTLHSQGDFEAALQLYETLLDLEPNNPVFHYRLGLTYLSMGNTARARRAFNRAIDLDPAYTEAYLSRANLYLGLLEYDRALADVEQALALASDLGLAHQIRGDILVAQQKFADAEAAYSVALERGQTNAQVYAGRGWARQRQGFNSTAVADYQQALALDPYNALTLYRMGFALYEVGRFAEALRAFEDAIQAGLDSTEAHIALAAALDANMRREEAEVVLAAALTLEPRYRDLSLLADLPPWSEAMIARVATILKRLEQAP